MALPPSASSATGAGGAVDPGAIGATDPMAGGGSDTDDDSGDTVVCTISKTTDGSYMVYAGDEPGGDDSGDDMSEDDADAMAGAGPAAGGAPPAAQGIPADSVGAALKAAMDILQSDKSSEGMAGNADDQLQAGFSASKSPTPATGMKQKF